MKFSLFTGIEMGLEALLMGTWVSRSVAVTELSPLADRNEVTSRSSAVVTPSANSFKLPRFTGGKLLDLQSSSYVFMNEFGSVVAL